MPAGEFASGIVVTMVCAFKLPTAAAKVQAHAKTREYLPFAATLLIFTPYWVPEKGEACYANLDAACVATSCSAGILPPSRHAACHKAASQSSADRVTIPATGSPANPRRFRMNGYSRRDFLKTGIAAGTLAGVAAP